MKFLTPDMSIRSGEVGPFREKEKGSREKISLVLEIRGTYKEKPRKAIEG